MDWRGKAGVVAIMVATLSIITIQHRKIESLSGERDKYKRNTESLIADVQSYRVRDSLSAARVQSLELTVKEFERFRADDAALVNALKTKNRDLSAINKAQAETIVELSAIPRDTMTIRDTIPIPAMAVHCGDEWFDFDGLLTKDEFTGTMVNRESLMLVESVKYKRFLGFLWKTRKVKDRQLDCVSRNPHTTIKGLEHVIIEK